MRTMKKYRWKRKKQMKKERKERKVNDDRRKAVKIKKRQ